MNRAVILGASRGLGAALARHIASKGVPTVGFARQEPSFRDPKFEFHRADFATPAGQQKTLEFLLEQDYSQVFYVAGGGPYGPFHEQSWSSHLWSWEVTFQFPARIAHALLAAHRAPQMVLISSSVAESDADPKAASYCAAKHALKGLFQTLRAENPGWDLRLFSPGYMDTEMLPKNAAVRKLGVYDPARLAEELWTWILTADKNVHKLYSRHP